MNEPLDQAITALRVKEDDPITAKLWNGLVDLVADVVRSFARLGSGSGVRLQRYPNGVNIVADGSRALFTGAFSVKLTGTKATIGAGTIENLTPTIDGVRIDGKDDAGKIGTIPSLVIDGGPGDGLISYVCAEIVNDEKGQINPDDADAVTVTHRQSLESADELTGILPLASVEWSDKNTISRVRQIVYFNQRHRFIPRKSDGTAAVHLFWPAS